MLPDAPVPDGRTVLTSPDTTGVEAVEGHGGHPPPFIRDTNPLERLNREIGRRYLSLDSLAPLLEERREENVNEEVLELTAA